MRRIRREFKKRSLVNPEYRRSILARFTIEELPWVASRYCGPNNMILAKKILGTSILTEEDVSEEIFERTLFGDPT